MNSRTDWRSRARPALEVRESDGDVSLNAQQAGSLAQLDRNRILARPMSIFELAPDPRQPRRVVPATVREQRYGNIGQMLDVWMWHAAHETEPKKSVHERPQIAPLLAALIAGEEGSRPESPGPILSALLAVAYLAASIRRDGLTNPITIAPGADNTSYVIETGERRWLAYHLLHHLRIVGDWSKIPARVVAFDVWRQASENNARANLNAIGRARQFAILLMDLLRERGETFAAFETFDREQDYYAQVADGETYRIPRGQSEKLLNALGLKNPQQLRQCRALLSLESQIWTAADDENWSTTNLVDYLKTGEKPSFGGYTVLINTVSPENDPQVPTGEEQRATNVAAKISQTDTPPPPLAAGAEVDLPGGRRGVVEGRIGTAAVKVRTARGTRVEKIERVRAAQAGADIVRVICLDDVLGAVERLYAVLANEADSMSPADVALLRQFTGDIERWLEGE